MNKLTHLDQNGNAQMVDVSEKEITNRKATATCSISMKRETLKLIIEGGVSKGDVLAVSRLAGIMAAKQTSNLIPLCHPISLTSIDLILICNEEKSAIDITSTCKVAGQTGVEMESLTAVSVAALTVYDMCKAVDRGMIISNIRLLNKSGGNSGTWQAD